MSEMGDVAVRLTRTGEGLVGEIEGEHRRLAADASIDALLTSADPVATAAEWYEAGTPQEAPADVLAPIESQEVWAAGVTYVRSRVARATESRQEGAAAFYDHVYEAERPELFFKATTHRVAGPGRNVAIRGDSAWNVPEPELTLVLDRGGRIVGHTIGNDMSSRSIEGENPLYLPQAKVYSASASVGPCLVVCDVLPGPDTEVAMTITRGGSAVYSGATTLGQLKRSFEELAGWLFRSNDFPFGVYLMTGTGIVPDDDFTLARGDEIAITIDGVGTLVNGVHTAG